jgi:hypothetical protein
LEKNEQKERQSKIPRAMRVVDAEINMAHFKGDEGMTDNKDNLRADKENYDRNHVFEVLSRVRKTGGIPLTENQKQQFQQWFRTLAVRGHTRREFLEDAEHVEKTYKEKFPNPNSRTQFIRAFMMYITGLTDDEFISEYGGLTREQIARTMRKVNTEANLERKERRSIASLSAETRFSEENFS